MPPTTLPLFPLPNVVLFPNVFLPLHIFEPRYRDMVADALEGDRMIGMVLLRPGWEGNYEGRPPVYPIGCSGLITHHERLPDGRYNIVLRGVEKFRIVEEIDDETMRGRSSSYRVARVEILHEPVIDADRDEVRAARHRLEALLVPQAQGRGAETKVAAGDGRRRRGQRAGAIHGTRTARKAGAARATRAAGALPVAHRAAGDEDDRRPSRLDHRTALIATCRDGIPLARY